MAGARDQYPLYFQAIIQDDGTFKIQVKERFVPSDQDREVEVESRYQACLEIVEQLNCRHPPEKLNEKKLQDFLEDQMTAIAGLTNIPHTIIANIIHGPWKNDIDQLMQDTALGTTEYDIEKEMADLLFDFIAYLDGRLEAELIKI